MSTRQWYRKTRVARFERIVEIRDILGNLTGVHGPEGQPKSAVTRFAVTLGLMAAVYIPVIIQDLSEGYTINWRLVALLSLSIFTAVALLFFVLSTHNHTYDFGEGHVACTDSHGEERWVIQRRDVNAIEVHRLRGQRFYLYLIRDDTDERFPIHCHPSICDKIRELTLVTIAFDS